MTVKKLWCVLLAVLLLALAMSSCGEGSSSGGLFDGLKKDTVYDLYDNLVRIDGFNNGLAAFMIYEKTSTSHWGSSGAWTGDYYYGYIDIEGTVVIEPGYECSPYDTLPAFEGSYVKVTDSAEREYIIDKTGTVQFEVGQNKVSAIGEVSQGYFWVETEKLNVTGNIYTVKYYSAKDMSVVATFENIRAIPDNRTIGGENSTLDEYGNATLAYDLDQYSYRDDDLKVFYMGEYDKSFSPTRSKWTVDMEEVSDYSGASYLFYHASGKDNPSGTLAAVALMNSNRNWFYSVIDSKGKVLMEPQTTVLFPIKDEDDIRKYEFRKDLCPAMDEASGYWGYVDPKGNWKIAPEYSSAAAFSADGYAIVNDMVVIDTEGKIVLSPKGWENEKVTSLSGTYKWDVNSSMSTWYITFYENGEVKVTESMGSFGSTWRTGKYEIKGSTLILSELGRGIGSPISNDGEYTFKKEGDTLFINRDKWVKSDVKLPN